MMKEEIDPRCEMGVSIYFICNFCFLNMRKLDFWSLPQCLFYCLIVCWLSFISEIKADFLLRIRQDRDISWQLIFLYFLGKKVSIYFVKFRLNLWKSKYVGFKKTGDKLSYNNICFMSVWNEKFIVGDRIKMQW
jgi:hypothetical protein